MVDTYFVGLRGSTDNVTDERPESWRNGILRLFPNGSAPLTALTALMPSEALPDPHFHWWTKTLTTQRSAVTNIFTNAGLSSAYTSGGVAGDVLYVNIPVAALSEFRAGHNVVLRDTSDLNVDCVGKILSVVSNGASSYLVVRLLEDDDNSSAGDLSDADAVLVMGNMNPEGGTRPEAISQAPTEFENVSQIFRNPLDLSRTRMRTVLRTADAYQEAKRDALEQHSIEMEKAFLFGVLFNGTGDNGKPERATRGIISYAKEHGTVSDYPTDDPDSDGLTWLQGGVDWLERNLELIFRFGGTERLALCGSGALLGIQRLVRNLGAYNLTVREAAFGIMVVEWVTPFGTIMLKTHPLFSYEATNRNAMLLIEPTNLRYRYIDDTTFLPDNTFMQGGGSGYDGKQEEYLTEGGLEVHFPSTMGWLTGFNTDNA